MNCLEAMELLQRRLDGELIDSLSLDEHVAQCAPCREQFAGAQQLMTILKASSWPVPPGTLTERIISEVLDDRRVRRAKLVRRLWITTALAASILLFVAGSYVWMPGSKKGQEVTNKQPGIDEGTQKAIQNFADHLAGKARDNAQKLASVASPSIGAFAMPDWSKLDDPLEPAAKVLQQSGRELGEGVQIVAQTTRQALDFFVRELPATRVTN